MTTDPIPPVGTTVAPVIDYEPPAHACAPCRPATSPAPAPAAPSPHRRGRPPRRGPDRTPRGALPPPLQSAAVFADAALRRVLEVTDGRRQPAHLHPLLAAGLAESVLSARGPARAEPATLQRVRVRPAGSGDPATAVEAFGTYRRGKRTHALACRIERAGVRWRIVALHIG